MLEVGFRAEHWPPHGKACHQVINDDQVYLRLPS
jgi:hypothetical protein